MIILASKIEYTIKRLLTEYIVSIPAIQRDYAFGRMGRDNELKRERFIKKLCDVILNNGKAHLDFIYGVTENDIFIPLDGQQRITTLWLIELYLRKSSGQETNKGHLSRFTYNTRTSTREFCLALLQEEWDLYDIDDLIVYLENKKWFFNSWRYDPTITGMCVVLQEIHKNFKDECLNELNTEDITFSFLDIENLGFPEDLYVKMNSRGKQLTNWDLFKANLFEYIDEQNWDGFDSSKFEKWIDGDFVDFFWSLGTDGKDKSKNTEKRMLRFFRLILFINAIDQDMASEENTSESKDVEKSNEIRDLIFKDWKRIINRDLIEEIYHFILFVKKYGKSISEIEFKRFNSKGLRIGDLFEILRKQDDDENYLADIDLFYAYFRFSLKIKFKLDSAEEDLADKLKNELKQVIRIVSNFEEPYRKQFSIEKVFLKAIKDSIDYGEGILEYFGKVDLSKEKFGAYSEEQKKEEIIKARLLLNKESDWSKMIYTDENHDYFNGTIGWILRLSDLKWESFQKWSSELLLKFDEKGIVDREEIAKMLKYKDIRFGELLPRNNGDSARNLLRDKSWKKLFREHGYKENVKNQKDISWIINWCNDLENSSSLPIWRKWIVNYPKILDNKYRSIGGVRIRENNYSNLFGNIWSVHQFGGKKYDIPLLIARIYIKDIIYSGFDSENDYTFATYGDIEITFDYKKQEYIIMDDDVEKSRCDAADIQNAVENLRYILEERK